MTASPLRSRFALFAAAAGFAACSKTKQAEPPNVAPAAPAPAAAPAPEQTAAPAPANAAAAAARMAENFRRVFFEFDSFQLGGESRDALAENAELMRRYLELKVEVQGHADDRGTTDYNLSLGQRRAEAVKMYLTGAGISSARIATISYGEERPIDAGEGEHAWSKNRRAEFRVTRSGAGAVAGTID